MEVSAEEKKKKNRKRNVAVSVRMTPDEKLEFDKKVVESGLSQSEYFIKCALQKEIKIIGTSEELNQIISEFNKQGTNLNQIAKKLNSDDFVSVGMYEKIHSDYQSLLETMLNILEKVR